MSRQRMFARLSALTLAAGLLMLIAASALLLIRPASSQVDSDLIVRIVARRVAENRTEFAIQQQQDGQWSERILPATRFLPDAARLDRWHHSSAVPLFATESDAMQGDTTPGTTPGTATYGVQNSGRFEDGSYFHGEQGAAGLVTRVSVFGEIESQPAEKYNRSRMSIFCSHDADDALAIFFVLGRYNEGSRIPWTNARDIKTWLVHGATFGVIAARDWSDYEMGGTLSITTSGSSSSNDPTVLRIRDRDRQRFLADAINNRWLAVRFRISDYQHAIALFDLQEAFTTPVQPLLERCLD